MCVSDDNVPCLIYNNNEDYVFPWSKLVLVFDGSSSKPRPLRVHIISLNFSIKHGLSPSLFKNIFIQT